jgi:hypothetical protein
MVMLWPAVTAAQPPFATDDADVTPRGSMHIEVFNEYDWLQPSQQPHLRQNTFNMRVNYGLTDHLELDLDAPLITIVNVPTATPVRPFGVGDTNFGVKYNLREDHHGARGVAVAVAAYVEVPTGDASTNLGSGATDVWIYGHIATLGGSLVRAISDKWQLGAEIAERSRATPTSIAVSCSSSLAPVTRSARTST